MGLAGFDPYSIGEALVPVGLDARHRLANLIETSGKEPFSLTAHYLFLIVTEARSPLES